MTALALPDDDDDPLSLEDHVASTSEDPFVVEACVGMRKEEGGREFCEAVDPAGFAAVVTVLERVLAPSRAETGTSCLAALVSFALVPERNG